MTKKQKVKKIIAVLHEKFGNTECALNYETPFELLVAVSLSAQCTDKRVNIVTEEMFRKKRDKYSKTICRDGAGGNRNFGEEHRIL